MAKKKRKNRLIYNVLFIIALIVFLVSGYKLADILIQQYQEGQESDKLIELSRVPKDPEKEAFNVDWDALRALNTDIVGWILIPDTDISYPIVQGSDNAYYLTHSYEGQEIYTGAIFMDMNADRNFNDRNTIIYGHNVKHGTMFAELENYKDPTFFEQHPYIYIFTPQQNYRSDLISMYQTDAESESYITQFADDESFLNYADMIASQSLYPRDVRVEAQDRLIMLSTCSYEAGDISDLRYVVYAKLTPWSGTYMQ